MGSEVRERDWRWTNKRAKEPEEGRAPGRMRSSVQEIRGSPAQCLNVIDPAQEQSPLPRTQAHSLSHTSTPVSKTETQADECSCRTRWGLRQAGGAGVDPPLPLPLRRGRERPPLSLSLLNLT